MLITLHWWCLYPLLALLLDLLELGDSALEVSAATGLCLGPEVFAERSVEFAVVADQGVLELLPLHL